MRSSRMLSIIAHPAPFSKQVATATSASGLERLAARHAGPSEMQVGSIPRIIQRSLLRIADVRPRRSEGPLPALLTNCIRERRDSRLSAPPGLRKEGCFFDCGFWLHTAPRFYELRLELNNYSPRICRAGFSRRRKERVKNLLRAPLDWPIFYSKQRETRPREGGSGQH